MESFKSNVLRVGENNEGEIPSCVAIAKNSEEFLFGLEAINANEDSYDLLIDWKVLVGKTQAEIAEKSASDDSLHAVIKRFGNTIQPLLDQYVRYLCGKIAQAPLLEDPDLIIGIPVTADYESKQWRDRYKQHVTKAFDSSGYKKPRFFPEPFAVFQHHWNKGNIKDTGEFQNILVIDVGGGTTNVCLIQTTSHGILARGGGNKIPHGVKSSMTGGSTLDEFIYSIHRDKFAGHNHYFSLISVREAKENIARQLRNPSDWEDDESIRGNCSWATIAKEKVANITAKDIKEAFCGRFWPIIKSTIQSSLHDVEQKNLAKPIDRIHQVIFAGGTTQLALFDYLFKKDFIDEDKRFNDSEILKDPDFNKSVSSGLAIEAFANSKNYEIKPTRVSAFLNEDIKLEVSHQNGDLYAPLNLSNKNTDFDADRSSGVIMRAPVNISPIINKKLSWTFKLKQKPSNVFYRISKDDQYQDPESASDLSKCVHVGKKGQKKSQKIFLNGLIDESGFLKASLEFSDDSTVYPLLPFDVHDLNGMEGSCFIGLDFGTNTTVCSFINAAEAIKGESLAESYWVRDPILQRCHALESSVNYFLAGLQNNDLTIKTFNQKLLSDYVYHSNRIEGSLLGRGQTKSLLENVPLGIYDQPFEARNRVERFVYVDESGEIKEAKRPIKDGLAAINLRDAFNFVYELSQEGGDRFGEHELRQVHQLVMRDESAHTPGHYRQHNVDISDTSYVPPQAIDVSRLISRMFERFDEDGFKNQPAILQAAEAHVWLVSIHPFSDGNGRVARLLVNYFLWKERLPPINLISENRDRYYDALDWCNTKEVSKRGDMSDLVSLFCDQFEEIFQELEYSIKQESLKDTEAGVNTKPEASFANPPLKLEESVRKSSFEELLSKISESANKKTFEEAYRIWSEDFNAIYAEVRKLCVRLDDSLGKNYGGSVRVIEYPIIDKDTYSSICNLEKFSRTWFFKIQFYLNSNREELVFYFGPSSFKAKECYESLEGSCSLHISRYSNKQSSHIRITEESWCDLREICHNGTKLMVLFQDPSSIGAYAEDIERQQVDSWFSGVVEGMLYNVLSLET